MKAKLFVVLLVSFLFVSCSSSTEPTTNSALSVTQNDNYLTLNNNSRETVYYLVVERETAALINWAPNYGDSKVLAKDSTNINYGNIMGLDQPFKSGAHVIVYYWYNYGKTHPDVFSKIEEL